MSFPRRYRQLAAIATKTLVWLVLASVCLSSLPIPIASVTATDDASGEAFPCKAGTCGCKTALKCWTSCCCHSPKERVAWAKQHGVAVPAYAKDVIRQAAEEQLAADAQSKSSKPSCCQKTNAPTATKSCCANGNTSTPKVVDKATMTQSPKRRLVLSMLAMRCQGSSGELASLPWAVMQLFVRSARFAQPLDGQVNQLIVSLPAQFYPPDTPPPKC